MPMHRPHTEHRAEGLDTVAQGEGRDRASTLLTRARSGTNAITNAIGERVFERARAITNAITGMDMEGADSDVPLLLLSVQLVPKSEVEKLPAGFGRSAPNSNPILPKQVGRLRFSLNPCRMMYDLLGPKLCRRLSGVFCCILCVLIVWSLIPVVIGNVVTAPFTG